MSDSILSFDKQTVKGKMRELVRKTIEETINVTSRVQLSPSAKGHSRPSPVRAH